MHTVKERTFYKGSRDALKQMRVLQHIGYSMFCVAHETHGRTCLVRAFATVERLVGKIVLHCVYKHCIDITPFLLFKLIPCHDIPIAHKTKNFLVALYFDEQSGTGHVATTHEHTVGRQLLEYVRFSCTLRSQFHEVKVVLHMG